MTGFISTPSIDAGYTPSTKVYDTQSANKHIQLALNQPDSHPAATMPNDSTKQDSTYSKQDTTVQDTSKQRAKEQSRQPSMGELRTLIEIVKDQVASTNYVIGKKDYLKHFSKKPGKDKNVDGARIVGDSLITYDKTGKVLGVRGASKRDISTYKRMIRDIAPLGHDVYTVTSEYVKNFSKGIGSLKKRNKIDAMEVIDGNCIKTYDKKGKVLQKKMLTEREASQLNVETYTEGDLISVGAESGIKGASVRFSQLLDENGEMQTKEGDQGFFPVEVYIEKTVRGKPTVLGSDTFYIHIKPKENNKPEQVTKMTTLKVSEGDTLRGKIEATDADNEPVAFYSPDTVNKFIKLLPNGYYIIKPGFDVVESGSKRFRLEYILTDGTDIINKTVGVDVKDKNARAQPITVNSDNIIEVEKGKKYKSALVINDPDSAESKFRKFSVRQVEEKKEPVKKLEETLQDTTFDGLMKALADGKEVYIESYNPQPQIFEAQEVKKEEKKVEEKEEAPVVDLFSMLAASYEDTQKVKKEEPKVEQKKVEAPKPQENVLQHPNWIYAKKDSLYIAPPASMKIEEGKTVYEGLKLMFNDGKENYEVGNFKVTVHDKPPKVSKVKLKFGRKSRSQVYAEKKKAEQAKETERQFHESVGKKLQSLEKIANKGLKLEGAIDTVEYTLIKQQLQKIANDYVMGNYGSAVRKSQTLEPLLTKELKKPNFKAPYNTLAKVRDELQKFIGYDQVELNSKKIDVLLDKYKDDANMSVKDFRRANRLLGKSNDIIEDKAMLRNRKCNNLMRVLKEQEQKVLGKKPGNLSRAGEFVTRPFKPSEWREAPMEALQAAAVIAAVAYGSYKGYHAYQDYQREQERQDGIQNDINEQADNPDSLGNGRNNETFKDSTGTDNTNNQGTDSTSTDSLDNDQSSFKRRAGKKEVGLENEKGSLSIGLDWDMIRKRGFGIRLNGSF